MHVLSSEKIALSLPKPVPYGYYLQNFRRAHGIERYFHGVPQWFMTGSIALFHWIAAWNILGLPYIDSVDYLLQVSSEEHSFDCSRFARDFGSKFQEESILECFVRQKVVLNQ